MKNPVILGFRPSRRVARAMARFRRACEGVAAVEFALILPLMLLLYLGSAETTQAVMASRKAAVAAQTLSDIVTQQAASSSGSVNNMTDAIMGSIFNAAAVIMQPFPTTTSALSLDVAAVSFTAFTAAPGSNVPLTSVYVPSKSKTADQFTPTATDPGYAAKVRWVASPSSLASGSTTLSNAAALSRVCSNSSAKDTTTNPTSTPLVPDTSTTNKATATTLQASLFGPGSLVLADISYTYTPLFGASIVKYGWSTSQSPLTTTNSIYNAPRDAGWATTACSEGNTTAVDHWICYPAQETGKCAYN